MENDSIFASLSNMLLEIINSITPVLGKACGLVQVVLSKLFSPKAFLFLGLYHAPSMANNLTEQVRHGGI